MNKIKELEELLEKDLLVELQASIKELTKVVKKQQHNKEAKTELQNMQDLNKDFTCVLEDIKNDSIGENEAKEILEGLDSLKLNEDDI